MNDIKKRIRALEQMNAEKGEQFVVVYAKPGNDTLYNADGSVYEGKAHRRIVFDWATRGLFD
jgi:hypothetical protein